MGPKIERSAELPICGITLKTYTKASPFSRLHENLAAAKFWGNSAHRQNEREAD